ncbi:MAG TPA: glycosyltransferase family 2 protein [Streptosporangiaceae bacterium]|nr:glycosyltransferase family 2 protein [Streptosporangiaceae bacterium]
MHHFENNSELRGSHPARHHRRAKLSGAADSRTRPPRAGRPDHATSAELARRESEQGRLDRLDARELMVSVAQAKYGARPRTEGRPDRSRNLPGLMQSNRSGANSAPFLSLSTLPAARPPLDRPLDRVNGNRRTASGVDLLSPEDFREVGDGIAIAPKVTVVLPVLNEAKNLPAVFETLPSWVDEVVLVDGRSTDDTIEVARELRPDVRVILQGGVGKGDALAAGFAAATGDIIVAIDGDGSTDGSEIIRFVSVLLSGADFAKGSRFNSAGGSDDITPVRRYGNKFLNVAVNRLFGTSFSDLCYGYNAFWARHLPQLDLDSPGFEIETLMSIRAAQAGLQIYEVPSHERLRKHGASNLSAIKDGWRILKLITHEKLDARRRKTAKPKPFMAPGHVARFDRAPGEHGGHDDRYGRGEPGDLAYLDGIVNGSAGQARR